MFSRVLKPVVTLAQNGAKFFTSSQLNNYKVTVVGASGGIGQPLALLLKLNPLVSHVAVYDIIKMTPGVAADLSHINTQAKVTGHVSPENLGEALKCADVVIVPAGVPRKPGMSRDDLFNVNATLTRDLACAIFTNCPKAIVAIITNPVNSVVPIMVEVLKKQGCVDPNRILGVTTLDLVRSSTFVGEITCTDPRCVKVPVIGGHSGITIVPVLSQSVPPLDLSDHCKIQALTKRIQEAGTEVVKAKAGGGSATLSMAFAGARLVGSVLKGLNGESNVVECAYVKTECGETGYFAEPLRFGPQGVEKRLGYGTLNEFENKLLQAAIPELKKNIKKGEDFVNK